MMLLSIIVSYAVASPNDVSDLSHSESTWVSETSRAIDQLHSILDSKHLSSEDIKKAWNVFERTEFLSHTNSIKFKKWLTQVTMGQLLSSTVQQTLDFAPWVLKRQLTKDVKRKVEKIFKNKIETAIAALITTKDFKSARRLAYQSSLLNDAIFNEDWERTQRKKIR